MFPYEVQVIEICVSSIYYMEPEERRQKALDKLNEKLKDYPADRLEVINIIEYDKSTDFITNFNLIYYYRVKTTMI